ncbi:MAG: rhodanese-like domain-containing protein [Candidatus Babeliaceae bacterium]|nr:rhodanese-like domain-containing protein [Candidatus Babeliaceae bacterium]
MKSELLLGVLGIAVVMLAGCGWFGKKGEKKAPKLRIVNVLDKKYFDDASIKGDAASGVVSINVPFEKLKDTARSWEKSVPVILYCSNYQCSGSGDGAQMLTEMGFDARAYEGGMAEWYQLSKEFPADFGVEGLAQEAYLSRKYEPVVPHGNVRIISAQELQKLIKQVKMQA